METNTEPKKMPKETKEKETAPAVKEQKQTPIDIIQIQFGQLIPHHIERIEVRPSKSKGFMYIGLYDTGDRLASFIETSSAGAEGIVEKLATELSKSK